jgi:hypothetical protein
MNVYCVGEIGSRNLSFLNWQDLTFVRECPFEDVVQWKFHKRDGTDPDEFNKAYSNYKSQTLTYSVPERFDYLRTYSCKNSSGCWHHFHLITKPLPKTTKEIIGFVGSYLNFSCEVFLERRVKEDSPIQNEPFTIEWKFPPDQDEEERENIQIVIVSTNTTYIVKWNLNCFF